MSTRFGLRLRAVGEAPLAVDSAGISVAWLRYRAVLICGLMTGIAGTYLSIAQNAAFSRDMTAGQGFIALAALIFGKWKPLPVFGACLMFGLFDAVAIRLQGVRFGGFEVPVQFDPGAALCADRGAARGLHRQRGRPQGDRRAVREGALDAESEDMLALARARHGAAPMRPIPSFRVGAVLRGAQRQALCGLQCRECRLSAGHLRRGRGDRRDGGRTASSRIVEAVVMGEGERVIAPCGGCRQHLREFADDATPIHLCGPEGVRRTVTLGELLPLAFGPDNLQTMTTAVEQCVDVIRARAPGFAPRAGVVLGSGLGDYARQAETVATIPYADLPGFPAPGVAGHSGTAGARPHRRHAGRAARRAARTITSMAAPT